MSLHRCTEPECPYQGQPSGRGCGCHKTDERVLRERVAALVDMLETVREEIEGFVDVVDGPEGYEHEQRPNWAMSLTQEIDEVIAKAQP